jgi:hypothetical protein
MTGFLAAWLLGEGIIVWRWGKHKAPPPPGALAVSSALFAALAVIASYEKARTAATLFAWGVDVAVLLQVLGKEPKVVTNWPPSSCIPDSQIFPSAKGGVPCGAGQSTAAGGSASGTSVPAPAPAATGGGATSASGSIILGKPTSPVTSVTSSITL